MHTVLNATADEELGGTVAFDGGFALAGESGFLCQQTTSNFGGDDGFLGAAVDCCGDGLDGFDVFGQYGNTVVFLDCSVHVTKR